MSDSFDRKYVLRVATFTKNGKLPGTKPDDPCAKRHLDMLITFDKTCVLINDGDTA